MLEQSQNSVGFFYHDDVEQSDTESTVGSLTSSVSHSPIHRLASLTEDYNNQERAHDERQETLSLQCAGKKQNQRSRLSCSDGYGNLPRLSEIAHEQSNSSSLLNRVSSTWTYPEHVQTALFARHFMDYPADLCSSDLVLDHSNGVTQVVDRNNVLGLAPMQTCKSYLMKRTASLLSLRKKRYVVLDKCSLAWYKSESDYRNGVRECRGYINFILHPCTVDFGHKDAFVVTIRRCNYSFVFSLPTNAEVRLKGDWMASLLVHINMADLLRSRFRGVAWDTLEWHLMHRLQPVGYRCPCSMCVEHRLSSLCRGSHIISKSQKLSRAESHDRSSFSSRGSQERNEVDSYVDGMKVGESPSPFFSRLFRSWFQRCKTALQRSKTRKSLDSQRFWANDSIGTSDFDTSLEWNKFWRN